MVSLLFIILPSTYGKILEHATFERLRFRLNVKELSKDEQFGFNRHRNSTLQLFRVTEYLVIISIKIQQ